ncbi:uncharacterized protein EI97DRAFT_430003 [Westerdykella ornata]|uniref:RRM domain-containing protein n=1 Tax=Westerdykella ornata TaxID=318751 RepID=A0A6A6JWZ4_WESOR|nr:uncharacterized protein EI97DRAFT_430003 [Westerdykella ornata]KAF2280256.1 hypothetical protein EI97DRAFT_430003 [Westerdykella ornata]
MAATPGKLQEVCTNTMPPIRFSLSAAISKAAPQGSRARAEQEGKDREEHEARKRLHAEFLEEHGVSDDEAENPTKAARSEDEPPPSTFVPTGAKRQFAAKTRSGKSGPGTLEALEPYATFSSTAPSSGAFGRADTSRNHHNDVYTKVVAKVSNLPPGTDLDTIKEIFAGFKNLEVVGVEDIQERQGPYERDSLAMKVFFEQAAQARDLMVAINELNDKKYLGSGYYLHLDRYLGDHQTSGSKKLPYGAIWEEPEPSARFAPTEELGGSVRKPQETKPRLVVTAYPPRDIETLRLIHVIIEAVLKGGKEVEAALMEAKYVKQEEKFAWLYDDKHPLNRYYRFRMYQLVTGDRREVIEIYPGFGEWRGGPPLPCEFADETNFENLRNKILNSAAEEEIKDSLRGDGEITTADRKFADPYPGMPKAINGIMSPMERLAFKTFLCSVGYDRDFGVVAARPNDVAAVTRFAIDHHGAGMDEIVDLFIENIFDPYILQPYNPRYDQLKKKDPSLNSFRKDAILNALRVVSDICMVVSSRLQKNTPFLKGRCYQYRAAIGTQLLVKDVFTWLADIPKKFGMGMLSTDVFEKDVNYIIDFWIKEALFDPDITETFKTSFTLNRKKQNDERRRKANPVKAAEDERKRAEARYAGPGKSITEGGADEGDSLSCTTDDIVPGSKHRHLLDNTNWRDSQDLTYPMPGGHVLTAKQPGNEWDRGESAAQTGSMKDESTELEPISSNPLSGNSNETAAARARRMRPKAEDMFASDED